MSALRRAVRGTVVCLICLGTTIGLLDGRSDAAQGDAMAGRHLGKLTCVSTKFSQFSGAQMKILDEGVIDLAFEKDATKPRKFRGVGTMTSSVSLEGFPSEIASSMLNALAGGKTTSKVREELRGALEYDSYGLPCALLITEWKRTSDGTTIAADVGPKGMRFPLANGAKLKGHTEFKIKPRKDKSKVQLDQGGGCKGDMTLEIDDECLALQTLLRLAKNIQEAFKKTPRKDGQSLEQYEKEVLDRARRVFLDEEGQRQRMDEVWKAVDEDFEGEGNLELVPLVPKVSYDLSIVCELPTPPVIIDWKLAGKYASQTPHGMTELLKQKYGDRIKLPDSAWEAVENAIADFGQDAEYFWWKTGPNDVVLSRLMQQGYLKRLIEAIEARKKEVGGCE